MDPNKKQQAGRKILFQIGGILFLIAACGLAFTDFKMYKKSKELDEKIQESKNKILQTQKETEAIKKDIANYNNSDYIEKIAREEQDMQKPGEKAVSFVMPKNQNKPNDQKTQNPFLGWLSQTWQWLKDNF